MNSNQQRGHCQCCGREQAVRPGVRNDWQHMAHHGYTVEYSFFNGVCPGHDYAPIESNRAEADRIIAAVRIQADEDCALAQKLYVGSVDPEYVVEVRREGWDVYGRRKDVEYRVPFCYAPEAEQQHTRRILIINLESDAKAKRDFCNMLERIANEFHGKPLRQVVKAAPAAPINKGDKRKSTSGAILSAISADGRRVYFETTMTDGRRRTGWLGTRAWRALGEG